MKRKPLSKMSNKELDEYIMSEQHIWDRVLRDADVIVESTKKTAKELNEPLFQVVYSWPRKEVFSLEQQGPHQVRYKVFPDIPTSKFIQEVKKFALSTDAFAFLTIIPQGESKVDVVVESRHGARYWQLKKERHGDLQVLVGDPVDNKKCFGLLWTAHEAQA